MSSRTDAVARLRQVPYPRRMDPATVTGELLKDVDSDRHFLRVPAEVRRAWSHLARRGAIRVTVTVGGSSWDASMLPWADGSAQVSVGAVVRRREGLREGDTVTAVLRPRDA